MSSLDNFALEYRRGVDDTIMEILTIVKKFGISRRFRNEHHRLAKRQGGRKCILIFQATKALLIGKR